MLFLGLLKTSASGEATLLAGVRAQPEGQARRTADEDDTTDHHDQVDAAFDIGRRHVEDDPHGGAPHRGDGRVEDRAAHPLERLGRLPLEAITEAGENGVEEAADAQDGQRSVHDSRHVVP